MPSPYAEDSRLWTAGGFSLADVLAGRAACPPAVRILVVVAWRPPVPAAPEPQIPPPELPGRVLARRASDFARPRREAAEEERALRGAWEAALGVLRPLAARRIGPVDLAFAAGEEAEAACRELFDLLNGRPGGAWRVGYARVGPGFVTAVRALELWVLDAADEGSWLVDVTDLR